MATPSDSEKARTELPPPQQQAELNPGSFQRTRRSPAARKILRNRRPRMMTPVVESEVKLVAHYMGYELSRIRDGYQLTRDNHHEQEVIVATSLELIADFLKH